uniref:Transposase MuDR plant domain-containing protein n=1 Tax=Lactuca sativa TaxID=4236 RepID=A0A9R1VKW8_LACSA|nr:hypothetical protein LSAT_V11C500268790 [Lactuca sativa]
MDKANRFNSNMSLSFQHPVHGYVMNIIDEADVHQLINVISETKEIVHLHLEVFEGWVEQTEAVEKIVPYNVENIVSDNVEECPQEETVAVNTVEEEILYEFGRLRDKTLSDDEDSNEGWSKDEFIHGLKASDIFYGMPPIRDCPDPIVEPGRFHNLGPNDDMFVRQTYDNKQQLLYALSLKATRENFQFKTKHFNKNRYEVYCEIENCSWHLYAKHIDPTNEFEIGTSNNVHTCSSLQIHPTHKHTNKKVTGTILHEIMGKTRLKVWRPNEISRDLNALLEINKHNPSTVAYIQTVFEDCFDCCFYAIVSTSVYMFHTNILWIRAFKRFCRKVIIMDGAHLKGGFKGTILHAVAMDGNKQIVPVAHRICKKEIGLTLTWFLEKLYDCVGDCQDLTFSTRPQVAAYLSEIPCAKWTRAYSPSKRCKEDAYNTLLEFFCRLSQEWCNKRRIDGGKHSTVLTEWAEKVVSKNEEHTTGWSISSVSDEIYQVHDFKYGGIVNLRQETCTCKYREGIGLPSGHVIMVLKHLKKVKFGHLAIDAYKMETC